VQSPRQRQAGYPGTDDNDPIAHEADDAPASPTVPPPVGKTSPIQSTG
jgi:hypothetical protein